MGASHELFCPPAEWRIALSDIGKRRARSVDQLSAQVSVAALADPEQPRFAAGCELTGDQAEPGREITTSVEAFRSPDRGDKRRRDERADPGDCRQSAGVFVLFRSADEFGVEGRDPSVELGPLRARVGDEQHHPRAQPRSALFVHQGGQERPGFRSPCGATHPRSRRMARS